MYLVLNKVSLFLIVVFFLGLHSKINCSDILYLEEKIAFQVVSLDERLDTVTCESNKSNGTEDEQYLYDIIKYVFSELIEHPEALDKGRTDLLLNGFVNISDTLNRDLRALKDNEIIRLNQIVEQKLANLLEITIFSTDMDQPITDRDPETIIENALAVEGESDIIYGVDCYTTITENGNLACAAVVSSILKHSNCGNKIHLGCCGLREHLRDQLGWKEHSEEDVKPGDVCFWRHSMATRERHVGIVVEKDVYDNWWTIDNDSEQLKVRKRPMVRTDKYKVIYPLMRK